MRLVAVKNPQGFLMHSIFSLLGLENRHMRISESSVRISLSFGNRGFSKPRGWSNGRLGLMFVENREFLLIKLLKNFALPKVIFLFSQEFG